jgi:hypothetical protein
VPVVPSGKIRLEVKSRRQEGTMTGTEMCDCDEFGLIFVFGNWRAAVRRDLITSGWLTWGGRVLSCYSSGGIRSMQCKQNFGTSSAVAAGLRNTKQNLSRICPKNEKSISFLTKGHRTVRRLRLIARLSF